MGERIHSSCAVRPGRRRWGSHGRTGGRSGARHKAVKVEHHPLTKLSIIIRLPVRCLSVGFLCADHRHPEPSPARCELVGSRSVSVTSSRSTESIWMSPPARFTGWSGRTARGRRRCSACCWAWPSRTAAVSRSWACRSGGRWRLPDGVAGFVDGPGLYPALTARGNLAALAGLRGPGAPTAGIDEVLAQVGLTDVADDKVRGFSLGMRQRLGLAAALLDQAAAARARRARQRSRPGGQEACAWCAHPARGGRGHRGALEPPDG